MLEFCSSSSNFLIRPSERNKQTRMNNCLPTGTIKAYTVWYSVCEKTNRGSTGLNHNKKILKAHPLEADK